MAGPDTDTSVQKGWHGPTNDGGDGEKELIMADCLIVVEGKQEERLWRTCLQVSANSYPRH